MIYPTERPDMEYYANYARLHTTANPNRMLVREHTGCTLVTIDITEAHLTITHDTQLPDSEVPELIIRLMTDRILEQNQRIQELT